MKPHPITSESGGSTSFGSPVLVVILVMMLGATVYLWQKRYIRRNTAYVTMAVLLLALIITGLSLYTSGA